MIWQKKVIRDFLIFLPTIMVISSCPVPDWQPYVRDVNSYIVLECCNEVPNSPGIVWKKDGVVLEKVNHYISTDKGQKLIINDAHLSDTGNYSCCAKLPDGKCQLMNHAFIEINSRKLISGPRITEILPKVYTKLGHNVNISCTVNSGKFLLSLQSFWIKDGVIINDTEWKYFNLFDRKVRDDSEDRINTLTIRNITTDDLGVYVCNARNDFGHDNKSLLLTLEPKPHPGFPLYVVIPIAGGCFLVLVILLTTAIVIKRKRMEELGPHFDIENYEEYDGPIEYDVFISYSSLDLDWVKENLYHNLNAEGYKVCIDFKDFMPGSCISSNIVDSINKSRKTLVVMSKNFLKSGWGIYEMEQAHYRLITQRKDILLIVKLDDCKLPNKLLGKTYLDWSDENIRENFWKRLFAAINKTKCPQVTEKKEGIDCNENECLEDSYDTTSLANVNQLIDDTLLEEDLQNMMRKTSKKCSSLWRRSDQEELIT